MSIELMLGFDSASSLRGLTGTLTTPRPGASGKALLNHAGWNIPLPALPNNTWMYWGFWWKCDQSSENNGLYLTGPDAYRPLIKLNGGLQWGNGGPVDTPSTTWAAGTWNYVVIGIMPNGAAGRVKQWLNGNLVINVTRNVGSGHNGIRSLNEGSNRTIDDMWVEYSTEEWTTVPNRTIATVRPDGAGAASDWGVSGAATGWEALADDSDTSLISSAVAGATSLFTYADVVADGTVVAVQTGLRGATNGTGDPQQLYGVHRNADGTVSAEPVARPLTTLMGGTVQVLPVNPATGAPWTVADINASQFGVRIG